MLPLVEYALVDENVTLSKALKTLAEAQKHPVGGHAHRAVLVRNKRGFIVGKMGHFAFLAAFLISGKKDLNDPILDRAGVSDDMISISQASIKMLEMRTGDDLDTICRRLQNAKVKD